MIFPPSSPGSFQSVEEIERELSRLRIGPDGTPQVRTSVLNLLVLLNEDETDRISEVVASLAGLHPCRAIILVSDPEAGPGELDARVATYCQVPSGGNRYICAETVVVNASGALPAHLESVAGPLLIPDLPVFLWCPGDPPVNEPDFRGVSSLADRIILDTGSAEDCDQALKDLAGLVTIPDPLPLGDLQWTRLTGWRSLIAQFFDSPDTVSLLSELKRVQIQHLRSGTCRTLLLTGWLASALGWTPERARRTGDLQQITFSGPAGEVSVELRKMESRDNGPLRRLRMETPGAAFEISRRRDLSDAQATIEMNGQMVSRRRVYLGISPLSVHLQRELEILGRDNVYEAALKSAASILELF